MEEETQSCLSSESFMMDLLSISQLTTFPFGETTIFINTYPVIEFLFVTDGICSA